MECANQITLFGNLGLKFGRRHDFVVGSARQAFNALIALIPGFLQELTTSEQRGVRYAVFVGDQNIAERDLDQPTGRSCVRIVPVVTGSKADGVWQTIAGFALFSAGTVSLFWDNPYAYSMMGLGASLALGGIAQMISAHTPSHRPRGTLNVDNVVSQGGPVPLLYGRMRVGPIVISACSEASDLKREGSE